MKLPPQSVRNQPLLFRALLWYGTRIDHKGQDRIHARLRSLLGPPPDVDFAVTRKGLEWVLNPADFTQRQFFWTGDKDHWDVYHIERIVRPSDLTFDIGANFGYYSLLLAGLVGSSGAVHAIEPTPETFERLQHHIDINALGSVITAHPIAFADREGMGSIRRCRENSGANSIESGGSETRLTTFDTFCERIGVETIDFAKIDIEGSEEKLLRGGSNFLLERTRALMIEVHPQQLERSGSSAERVLSMLAAAGFRTFTPQRTRLVPLKEAPSGRNYVNVFAIRA